MLVSDAVMLLPYSGKKNNESLAPYNPPFFPPMGAAGKVWESSVTGLYAEKSAKHQIPRKRTVTPMMPGLSHKENPRTLTDYKRIL